MVTVAASCMTLLLDACALETLSPYHYCCIQNTTAQKGSNEIAE